MRQRVISAFVVSLLLVVTSVADDLRQTPAITPPAHGSILVRLKGTYRLPDADGVAKVIRHQSSATIHLGVDDLMPATLFGGDFNTYVVWIVSEEGQPQNVGELLLNGDRGEIELTTERDTFGLLVTAEPHFMVQEPSRFVVVEPLALKEEKSKIHYAGFTGVYNFKRTSLNGLKEANSDVQNGVQQALTALRLAQRANAPEFAPEEFQEAQRALDSIGTTPRDGVTDSKSRDEEGREAVRLAVEAESIARDRALAGIPGSEF